MANLLCLLMGFALLSRHFEKSHIPLLLTNYLPDDWIGAFVMLMMVFVLSSFLDNIAAALIGGAIAHQLFRGKVHIGYLAAIVAAAKAGGAGSVVGGTATTMLWISGGKTSQVFDAYVAAVVALLVCGIPAPFQQHNDEIGFFVMLMALGWHPDASIKKSEVVIPASVPTIDASPASNSR